MSLDKISRKTFEISPQQLKDIFLASSFFFYYHRLFFYTHTYNFFF